MLKAIFLSRMTILCATWRSAQQEKRFGVMHGRNCAADADPLPGFRRCSGLLESWGSQW
jgi:hypothetical protein